MTPILPVMSDGPGLAASRESAASDNRSLPASGGYANALVGGLRSSCHPADEQGMGVAGGGADAGVEAGRRQMTFSRRI